jgi:DNA-binding transcriptional regulator YhcF (GntR family)
MWNQLIQLSFRSKVGLQAQIREMLVAAILDGHIPVGVALPSTRVLAAQLGVARNTVALAYELLVNEGYLLTKSRSGHFVNPGDRRRPGGAAVTGTRRYEPGARAVGAALPRRGVRAAQHHQAARLAALSVPVHLRPDRSVAAADAGVARMQPAGDFRVGSARLGGRSLRWRRRAADRADPDAPARAARHVRLA